MDYSPQATVEVFHLLLLDLLTRSVDKRSTIVKQGCNLRFFMKSCRYSDGMDLDLQGIGQERLQDAMSGMVEGPTLAQLLELRGIRITRWSAPKQTATTQRWKLWPLAQPPRLETCLTCTCCSPGAPVWIPKTSGSRGS